MRAALVSTLCAGLALCAGGLALAPAALAQAPTVPPLVEAARDGDVPRALALLDDGAEAGAAEANGTSALIWAAHRSEPELVRRLLREGADPNARNAFGATAIGEAASTGDAAVLELLLDAGVDPDMANPEGQTPLMAVARTGRLDAARALLDAGAEIDAAEEWGGQTALMWATSQGHPEMVKLLLDAGAAPNLTGIARNWQRRVTVEPRKKIMADGGFAALHYAARENCIACAIHLIAAGADIDIDDPDRITPLNIALMNRHFDLAAVLIEAGADVNRWDFAGRTPLYNAVDMNTPPPGSGGPIDDALTALDLVAMLLAEGADPNIQLKRRPEYRQGVNERGADIMLSAGAAPLMRAARSADIPVMEMLLEAGAIADMPNQYGVTPMMVAAGVGFGVRATRGLNVPEERRVEAVAMLLDAGADINLRTLSLGRVQTPELDNFLYRVRITYGNQRYIHSYVPPDGRIAMHGAAMNGWTQMVRFLAENGSDIDVRARDGLTPLDLAAGNYEPQILVPPADPFPETMEALEELCAARPGCSFDSPEAAGAGEEADAAAG